MMALGEVVCVAEINTLCVNMDDRSMQEGVLRRRQLVLKYDVVASAAIEHVNARTA